VFEPGTKWQYGVGPLSALGRWQRIHNSKTDRRRLGRKCRRASIWHVLERLFPEEHLPASWDSEHQYVPTPQMKNRLAHMHQKANGKISGRDHILRRPLIHEEDQIKDVYNSAGAGCFARPLEYCRELSDAPPCFQAQSSTEIIATLLNDGKSPTTGNRILEAATVQEMFSNQIPNMPNLGRQGIPASKPDYTNPLGDLYPQPAEQPQGWGISMFLTIHPAATGRGANTGWWAGLPHLFWWCDREKGVGEIIASQIVPFGGKWPRSRGGAGDTNRVIADPYVLGLWFGIESALYASGAV